MPELPEVETVCRVMRHALVGRRLVEVEIPEDPIVLSGLPAERIRATLIGQRVMVVGRRGKYWWLELDSGGALCGHLGMAGWIRELGKPGARLMEHGSKPLDDENGRPRFLKMLLTTEDGAKIAFTDARRLGRLWLAEDPSQDKRIGRLGPDALDELPSVKELASLFAKRSAPIKAILLDQAILSGIGNYLADEMLYQSGISPKRSASSLTPTELKKLRNSIVEILETAIAVEADFERFPPDWLFHSRWGGARGKQKVDGQRIMREQVGGRTTAWVPARQK